MRCSAGNGVPSCATILRPGLFGTKRTVERAVLSVDTVAGSHIGRDASIRQPLQELPVPVGRVGRYLFWLSSLPLPETGEHVLRGHRPLHSKPQVARSMSDMAIYRQLTTVDAAYVQV